MIAPMENYSVEPVPIEQVKPTPENDEIYGACRLDNSMRQLMESISEHGLEEPLIVTADGYILSGHRRFFACSKLGMEEVPVRRKSLTRSEYGDELHKTLAAYNPQRVKTINALMREALLADADNGRAALYEHRHESLQVEASFECVEGLKHTAPVGDRRSEFLDAAKRVIDELKAVWPLSIRQIHYQLLNDPPLKQTLKKGPNEKHRYQNNHSSYKALVDLLSAARYAGQVPMNVIKDETRRPTTWKSYADMNEFVRAELKEFMSGFYRTPQLDQPRYIEVLAEKNTLRQVLKPILAKYGVPATFGRGYGSVAAWHDTVRRYKASGKERMSLIVVSDYDPEGLDLAKDAVRTLRGCFGITVDYCRVGVARNQIDELQLAHDYNPAKRTSPRYNGFVEATGSDMTWEVEALPVEYLQTALAKAIESNMDMELFDKSMKRLNEDVKKIAEIRRNLADDFDV